MKATKLPSGNWRVQVLLGMDANGKRVRKSFTGANRKEVEAEAHHYLVTHSDAVKDDSFGVAAERFLLDRESVLSPSTMVPTVLLQNAWKAVLGRSGRQTLAHCGRLICKRWLTAWFGLNCLRRPFLTITVSYPLFSIIPGQRYHIPGYHRKGGRI